LGAEAAAAGAKLRERGVMFSQEQDEMLAMCSQVKGVGVRG
jgi:hypothetical protein